MTVLTANEQRGSHERVEALRARRCLHKGSTLFYQVTRYLRTLDGPSTVRQED